MAPPRRGDNSRLGARVQCGRAARVGAGAEPRAPSVTHGGATDADQRRGPPLASGVGLQYEFVDHQYISPELGKGEFAQFLQHLLVYHPGKRLLVIHDRGGQHKGTPVDAVVREAQGRLVLKPQPAYSPELNPQERIWKWLRRVVTHNHWFATLTAQIEAIRNFFRYLAGVKAQVRRLCSLKTPESYLENSLGRGGRAWFELHLIAQILEASRQPVHQLVALPLIEVVGP